jgi:hypothetical protein
VLFVMGLWHWCKLERIDSRYCFFRKLLSSGDVEGDYGMCKRVNCYCWNAEESL